MKIKVKRYDGENGKPAYWQDYVVPKAIVKGFTVIQILDYIANNIDGSLAYYRHSSCMHGVCGRCAIRVNGKAKLACLFVPNEDVIELEPLHKEVCRDLVCK